MSRKRFTMEQIIDYGHSGMIAKLISRPQKLSLRKGEKKCIYLMVI
jgi:hypothetical protein